MLTEIFNKSVKCSVCRRLAPFSWYPCRQYYFTGHVFVELSGETSCELSGEMSGELSGETSGELSGEFVGRVVAH